MSVDDVSCSPCQCCGYHVLPQDARGYEICPICYFQDEPLMPDREKTLDQPTLLTAQRNFQMYGACLPELAEATRGPYTAEERAKGWRPLDDTLRGDLDRLITGIRQAFHGVILGNGTSLKQADDLDGYLENPERGPDEETEDWSKVPVERHRQFQAFPFLDSEGMRFYLPAWLIWMLEPLDSKAGSLAEEFMMYTLMRGPNQESFYRLSTPQYAAVVEFLRYLEVYAINQGGAEEAFQARKKWEVMVQSK